jgi:hypothetical protein
LTVFDVRRERLQAGRQPAERLAVEIPWLEVMTAFTATFRFALPALKLE